MAKFIPVVILLGLLNSMITNGQLSLKTDSVSNSVDSAIIHFGVYSISQKQAQSLTSFAGEHDDLKILLLTPGITKIYGSVGELSVHGLPPSGNQVLLDGVKVYYPYHIFNSTSIIQSEMVQSVKLMSDNFPASYGNSLCSAIDVTTKDGNKELLSSSVELTPVSAGIAIEGPVVKNILSAAFSSRYNYSSVIGNYWSAYKDMYIENKYPKSISDKNGFFDMNGKLTFYINSKNSLSYFACYSRDFLDLQDKWLIKYSTHIEKIQWAHKFNNKAVLNNSIAFNNFNSSHSYKYDTLQSFELSNGIKEISYNCNFNYPYREKDNLEIGFSGIYNQIQPYKLFSEEFSLFNDINSDKIKCLNASLFIENKTVVNEFLSFNVGLRYNTFSTYGKRKVFSYITNDYSEYNISDTREYKEWELIDFFHNLEPRLNAVVEINKNLFSFSYANAKQYLNMTAINNDFLLEVWYPANRYIKPQEAHHFAITYKRCLINNTIDAGIKPYYGIINNIKETKDGADIFLNQYLETEIVEGKAKTSGIEFFLKKNSDKFSGWLSYTLSKSMLQFSNINNSKAYHAAYDRLHNLSLVLFYEFSEKWIVSSDFIYTSGAYFSSFPQIYRLDNNMYIYYGDRNKYQQDDYKRVDIAATYTHLSKPGKWKCKISFGIYNLLNEKYIYGIEYLRDLNSVDTSPFAANIKLGSISPYIKIRLEF